MDIKQGIPDLYNYIILGIWKMDMPLSRQMLIYHTEKPRVIFGDYDTWKEPMLQFTALHFHKRKIYM